MLNKILLFLIIGLHYGIFISFLFTGLLGFFYLPWFVYITTGALVVRVIVSRDECPLTTLENVYRNKFNLVMSKGFLKDYIIYPKRTFKYLIKELLYK